MPEPSTPLVHVASQPKTPPRTCCHPCTQAHPCLGEGSTFSAKHPSWKSGCLDFSLRTLFLVARPRPGVPFSRGLEDRRAITILERLGFGSTCAEGVSSTSSTMSPFSRLCAPATLALLCRTALAPLTPWRCDHSEAGAKVKSASRLRVLDARAVRGRGEAKRPFPRFLPIYPTDLPECESACPPSLSSQFLAFAPLRRAGRHRRSSRHLSTRGISVPPRGGAAIKKDQLTSPIPSQRAGSSIRTGLET